MGNAFFESSAGVRVDAASSPLAFAAVLRLAAAAGHAIPRAQLCELFWGVDATRTRVRLRTLLARLREFRVPVESSADSLAIPPQLIDWLDAGDGALLDEFESPSPAFERWLERNRHALAQRFIAPRLAELSAARDAHDWIAAERAGRAIAQVDPLNEGAHLAVAEALAFTGSKQRALAYLDGYLRTMGERAVTQKSPLGSLERRIRRAIRGGAPPHDLIERTSLLSCIMMAGESARRDALPGGMVLEGPQGIGKSALLREAAARFRLMQWNCLDVRLLPSEHGRPLSAISGIARSLLDLPYAISASVESVSLARSVASTANAAQVTPAGWRAVANAIGDLLSAVSEISPLTIVIDDAQRCDAASREVLDALLAERQSRREFWLVAERAAGSSWPRYFTITEVPPLSDAATLALFLRCRRGDPDSVLTDADRAALAATGGRPEWIRTLALGVPGETPSTATPTPGLREMVSAELRNLSDGVRQLLLYVCLLGPRATVARLTNLYRSRPHDLREAITAAEKQSLLSGVAGGRLDINVAWSEALVAHSTPGVRRVAHHELFTLLAAEAANGDATRDLLEAAVSHARHAGELPAAVESVLQLADELDAAGETSRAVQLLHEAFVESQGEDDLQLRLAVRAMVLGYGILSATALRPLILADEVVESIRPGEPSLRALLAEIVEFEESRNTPSLEVLVALHGIIESELAADSVRLLMLEAGLRMHAAGMPDTGMTWKRFSSALDGIASTAGERRYWRCSIMIAAGLLDQAAVSEKARESLAISRAGKSPATPRDVRELLIAASAQSTIGAHSAAMATHQRVRSSVRGGEGSLVSESVASGLAASWLTDAGRWSEADAELSREEEVNEGPIPTRQIDWWAARLSTCLAQREFDRFRAILELRFPGIRPRALAPLPQLDRALLGSLECAWTAAMEMDVERWRDEITRAVEDLHSRGGLGELGGVPEGVVWRLAVADSAIGEATRARQLVQSYLAHRAGRPVRFPFTWLVDRLGNPHDRMLVLDAYGTRGNQPPRGRDRIRGAFTSRSAAKSSR
jgi:hypothetical protein